MTWISKEENIKGSFKLRKEWCSHLRNECHDAGDPNDERILLQPVAQPSDASVSVNLLSNLFRLKNYEYMYGACTSAITTFVQKNWTKVQSFQVNVTLTSHLLVGGVKSTHNVDHLAFFKPAARVRHATLLHALIAVRAVEVRVGVPVFVAVMRVGHTAALKLRWIRVERKHEVDVRLVTQC